MPKRTMHLRARTDKFQVRDRPIEDGLLIRSHRRQIQWWIRFALLFRSTAPRTIRERPSCRESQSGGLAKVLAGKQSLFAGASQITQRANAHLGQAIATAYGQFKVADGTLSIGSSVHCVSCDSSSNITLPEAKHPSSTNVLARVLDKHPVPACSKPERDCNRCDLRK